MTRRNTLQTIGAEIRRRSTFDRGPIGALVDVEVIGGLLAGGLGLFFIFLWILGRGMFFTGVVGMWLLPGGLLLHLAGQSLRRGWRIGWLVQLLFLAYVVSLAVNPYWPFRAIN